MRQLYALSECSNKWWSVDQGRYVSTPQERDIFTRAYLDAHPHNATNLVKLIDNPKHYVYIYDIVDGKVVRDRRKTPYAYLIWGDDYFGKARPFRSAEELAAAVRRRWDEAESLGSAWFPIAHVYRAFSEATRSNEPDYYLERGPRGGAQRTTG